VKEGAKVLVGEGLWLGNLSLEELVGGSQGRNGGGFNKIVTKVS